MASPNPAAVYGKVQLTFDDELRRLLERAAKDIQTRIGRLPVGIGGEVRKSQLQLVLNEIRNIQQGMWTQGVTANIARGSKAAAKAAEDAVETLERVLYTALPESVAQVVSGGLRATAMAGIERVHARVPRELSARVYHDFALTSGHVEQVIRSGIVSGLSARELARDVYQYVSPTTPGGASYAAMRLARTEINNSFHEQQKAGGQRPGVRAVKWNLSGSHRKPDLCNVYASQDVDGLGKGLYKPGNVPDKPHPQCLCYLTYDTMSPKDFERALKAGKFDDELDRRIAANLERLGRPPVKASPPTPRVTGHHPEAERANKLPPGKDRDRVQAILDKQAGLAPKAMARLDRVARATHAEQIEMGADGLGGYLAEERRIAIGHDAFSAQADRAWKQEVASKWSAATPVDGIEGLMSHEFGHHVALALDEASPAVRKAFWQATAKDLDIKPPLLFDRESLDRWVQRNADAIAGKVSRYAVADGEAGEVLAEIWLEYSTNPEASAWARSIGERLREVSEGPRVVAVRDQVVARVAATGEEALAQAPASMLTRPGVKQVLSDNEIRAFGQYRGIRYNEINGLLRGQITKPFDTLPGQMSVRQIRREMASGFAKSELRGDIVVWRGASNRPAFFGDRWDQDLTGFKWKEKAYSSTSASQRQAEIFAPKSGNGVLMRITVRRGTRAVQLSGTDAEWELLLDKGYNFRVVADRGFDPETGIRLLDVEVTS